MSEQQEQFVSGVIYTASWGQVTPEQAAKQIMEHLNPTIWPRLAPSYGTTGTRRIRRNTR